MPVKMAPHQLAFWQELMAPFADHELSEVPARGGKKTLTYIDKRALSNRLDSVCGPNGWDIEFKPTARGYTARLGILCPSYNGDAWVWHYKEDGAGFEEMGSTNKTTGEFEYDVDNDEKSGYTNAFRRVAQDAWGIGRYLYRKGIPAFLDPNARPSIAPSSPAPSTSGQSQPSQPAPAESQPQQPSPTQTGSTGNSGSRSPQGGGGFDNFKIPPPGKSVFAWCKEMEKAFETQLVDGMGREGEKQGWGRQFNSWSQDQVNTICLGAIKYIRELPSYKGQYEHLFPGGVPDAKIPTAQGSGPNTQPTAPGVNIADLRKGLMAKMQALVAKQTGQPADNAGLKAVFNKIASSAANCEGHTGEVPESLSKLSDIVWLNNMIALVDKQIEEAGQAADEGSADIPF